MKKLSSIFYMWMGFGLAVVATLSMFLPSFEFKSNVISATSVFWATGYSFSGAWASFIGYMLILAGGIMMAVMAFPTFEPSAKVEKIVLISAACAIVVGVILAMLVGPFTLAATRNALPHWLGAYHTGMYLTAIFGLGAAAMSIVAVVMDW